MISLTIKDEACRPHFYFSSFASSVLTGLDSLVGNDLTYQPELFHVLSLAKGGSSFGEVIVAHAAPAVLDRGRSMSKFWNTVNSEQCVN